jgi:prepilin peptidase CpaA
VNLATEAPQWLALILAILLVVAAAEDAARLRISNVTVLLVLVGAVAAAAVAGPEVGLWQNLVVVLALLAVGMPMFAAGKLGGGDVKLLAAVGLWFDFKGALWMLIAVAIAGGSSCCDPAAVFLMVSRSPPEHSSQWCYSGCDRGGA